jgi:hypothetical protein
MAERRGKERRKVNQVVGKDMRGKAQDRRHCPECGSSVRQSMEPAPGGTLTIRYCTKCDWNQRYRQVDEAQLMALAGFEMQLQGAGKKVILELPPEFLKAAGLKATDHVELKALYTPGGSEHFRWVLRRL